MKSLKKHLVPLKKSLAVLMILAGLLAAPAMAMAVTCSDNSPTCGGPSGNTGPSGTPVTTSSACQNTSTATQLNNCVSQSPLVRDIQKIVNFLSAGIGVVVIGVIILGGIQYSMAGDNSQAVGAAKQRIINGLIALVAFIFMFAFLNWLLPGGAFG